MPQLFSNNARSTLTSTISAVATSLTIQPAAADLFPVANVNTGSIPSANNWFKATIQDVSGNVEIVYVRTRTSGSGVFSNIIRGQEGTTAQEFVAGSIVGLRVTAADFQVGIDLPGADTTFTGDNVFSGDNTFNGDLTGNVTGNVTGNAGTVTNGVYTVGDQTIEGDKTFSDVTGFGDDWTIEQSGTSLVFKYSGTAVFKLTSAGAVVAKDDITAFGTP